MRKIVIGIVIAIVLIVPCVFLFLPAEAKESKFFINIKSESAAFHNFKNDEFEFNYGDMNVYDISLEDFKIMVKFDDGSVKAISNNDENLEFSYSLINSTKPAEVGEYYITISYKSLTKSFKVLVSNIQVFKPSLTLNNFVYDGFEKSPKFSNYNINGNNPGIIATGEFSKIDAGSYYISFSLEDGYIWSDGTTSPVLLSWDICKRKITQEDIDALGFRVSGENGLDTIYNGEVKNLQSAVELPEHLMICGETSSTTIGNYFAEIKIKDDYLKNYEFEENVVKEIAWRISKIKIDIPSLINSEIDYFENMNIEKSSLFRDVSNDNAVWKDESIVLITGFANNITSVGTYTFKFRIIDKAHYMWIDGSEDDIVITFKVDPIDFDMSWYEEVIELETVYNRNKTLNELKGLLVLKINELYSEENINPNNFEFANVERKLGDAGEKLVKAFYTHNSNYNEMEIDIKLNVVPYEFNFQNAVNWFIDADCKIPYNVPLVYNGTEQGIYAKVDETLLQVMRIEVGEDFGLAYCYEGNLRISAGEQSAKVITTIKETEEIKASNYSILNFDNTKTLIIHKAVLNLGNENHLDWTNILTSGKIIANYTGNEINIVLPKINYSEILGIETNGENEIGISVVCYQDSVEVLPVNAGNYDAKFNFNVLDNSNFRIEGEKFVIKELVINKADISEFETTASAIVLGEKLKNKVFDISFKDFGGNIIENANFIFKNRIDAEKIPTSNGSFVLELVHDNYVGEVSVNYEVVNPFEKIIVRDKVVPSIYGEISGKEFYELISYNADKTYELYFKAGYDFKIYNENDEELESLSLDFANNKISQFKIIDKTNNITLNIPNCIVGDVEYLGLTHFGNLSTQIAITSVGEGVNKSVFDTKFYLKGEMLEELSEVLELLDWEGNDYFLTYEVSSDINALKIELEDVFDEASKLKVVLYDKNGNEVQNEISSSTFEINPKSISRVIVTYNYGLEELPRIALDLSIVDKTLIDNVVVTKLSHDGTLKEQNISRGYLADYEFSSNLEIVTNISVDLKEEFNNFGYIIKITKDGSVFDYKNQDNNQIVYIQIYDGDSLLESRSVSLSYDFEFEKIEDGILKIDKDDFYYLATSSNGKNLYINSSGAFEIVNGVLNNISAYLDFEEKLILYNFETINYSSVLDDETGEFNVVDGIILSKNAIETYGGTYYEVYDSNYIRTGKFTRFSGMTLKLYEVLGFNKDLNDDYLKYYFLCDYVVLGENKYLISFENIFGYMGKFSIGQNEVMINISLCYEDETYLINDKIIVEIL